MIKALMFRVLPAGAAAALLFSSASPLKPALHAFESAGNALGGDDAVNTSDIAFPDEAAVNSAVGGGWANRGGDSGGFSLGKMLKNLFGPSNSDRARSQLAEIIAGVKANSQAPIPGAPAGKGTGKATASGKGVGKAGAPANPKGTTGGKATAPAKAAPPAQGVAGP